MQPFRLLMLVIKRPPASSLSVFGRLSCFPVPDWEHLKGKEENMLSNSHCEVNRPYGAAVCPPADVGLTRKGEISYKLPFVAWFYRFLIVSVSCAILNRGLRPNLEHAVHCTGHPHISSPGMFAPSAQKSKVSNDGVQSRGMDFFEFWHASLQS